MEEVDLMEPSSDDEPLVEEEVDVGVQPQEEPVAPNVAFHDAPHVPPIEVPIAPQPPQRHRLPVTLAARNKQLKMQLHRSQRRRIALQEEVDVARAAERELKQMFNDLVRKYNTMRGELITARDYNLVAAAELAEVKEARHEYATALKQIRDVVAGEQNLDD